jgi:hypothetical protein
MFVNLMKYMTDQQCDFAICGEMRAGQLAWVAGR